MSSNKTQKWSSPASLTKLVSRITRTLSFSSSKKNNKTLQHSQPILKNASMVPKSVPVIRRHPPQTISKFLANRNRQGIHVNMYGENDNEDDDCSRYSLQPNLSLFNISTDNLHYQSEEYYQQAPQQENDWIDEIFHSTKVEH